MRGAYILVRESFILRSDVMQYVSHTIDEEHDLLPKTLGRVREVANIEEGEDALNGMARAQKIQLNKHTQCMQ